MASTTKVNTLSERKHSFKYVFLIYIIPQQQHLNNVSLERKPYLEEGGEIMSLIVLCHWHI